MLKALSIVLTAILLAPIFSYAQDDSFSSSEETYSVDASSEYMARTRCSARAIDRYYCPSFGGSQWMGPYWDNGCSVRCSQGQRAVCKEATCEEGQTGRPVESSCTCQ